MKKKTSKKKNLSLILHAILSDPSYTPLSRTALFKQLDLSHKEQVQGKEVIDQMLEKKEILLEGSKLVYKKQRASTLRGILRVNPRGFGFFIPENRSLCPEDAFIPKHCLLTAVDGDTVDVEVFPSSKKNKGPEGRVVSVVERGRSNLAGTVKLIDNEGTLYLFSPFLGANKQIQIRKPPKKVKEGDRVIANVLDWGGGNSPILAEVTHLLGHISDASLDVPAAVEEFSLRKAFPKEVMDQVKLFGTDVSPKDCKNRLDLSHLETFTIDPTTAKDFDDALSLSKDSKGNYLLYVHIADVAHYVQANTPLDVEAQRRCNSTYFPGSCLPMLPEELSNHLCSLKPNVLRLCVSVIMTFNPQGDLLKHETKRTVINSDKRFTYEEAKQVLDGEKKSKYLPSLQLMVDLCLLLKKKRHTRGSVDFSIPEVVLDLDSQGTPVSYHIVEYDITHQLVEEFMLKANETTAQILKSRNIPLIFRVHEEPKEETLEEFFGLARSLGFFVPAKPTPEEVQKLFDQAKQTSYAQQLSIAFIRSMKLATYSPDNVGHFGLSLEEYCHFTSPIRRYPDLIIQRLLFNELPTDTDLEKIAEACSEKERISFKAEQTVKTLKKLRLLKQWYTEDPEKVYTCFISKIRPFGLSFELAPLGIEGSLHMSELQEDYFVYEQEKNSLFGRSSHVRLSVGDPIEVKIRQVDLVVMETKWEKICDPSITKPERTKKSRSKKRKHRRKKTKP